MYIGVYDSFAATGCLRFTEGQLDQACLHLAPAPVHQTPSQNGAGTAWPRPERHHLRPQEERSNRQTATHLRHVRKEGRHLILLQAKSLQPHQGVT